MKLQVTSPDRVHPIQAVFVSINVLFEKKRVELQSAWWLGGILALGILLILPIFLSVPGRSLFATDNGSWTIASNLLHGRGYSACDGDYFPFCSPTNQATAMREPLPVFLMALAMLISPSAYSVLVMQSLFYLGTALVIYAILHRNDRRIALLAAFLWTVSLPVLSEIDHDNGELAAAFFLSLGLFHFLKGRNGAGTWQWILAGAFLGLASLSRTVLLGVSVGLGLALLVTGIKDSNRSWGQKLLPSLLLLSMVGFTVAPWIIRNHIVFGQPVIGSTLTGYNVLRMNHIIASDNFQPHYVGSTEGYAVVNQLIETSDLSGLENEAQMQSLYMHTGLEIILQNPLRYVGLSLYRFLPLWFNTSVDLAYNVKPRLMDHFAVIQQALLLIAVVISIGKKPGKNWPFILTLVLGSGAYMAIGAQLRYLVDFMPVVVILAAQAVPNLKLSPAR